MSELSLGELDSLVLKAYRGAGFSWGMAQEAGRAAAWLAAHGLPAATLFTNLLKQIDGTDATSLTPDIQNQRWQPGTHTCCPVVCGTALSDLGLSHLEAGNSIALGSVYSPAILLPFVAGCATADGVNVTIRVDKQPLLTGADGSYDAKKRHAGLFSEKGQVELEISAEKAASEALNVRRAVISAPEAALLEQLAHRTYVPASELSRSSGAGAGLNDND